MLSYSQVKTRSFLLKINVKNESEHKSNHIL